MGGATCHISLHHGKWEVRQRKGGGKDERKKGGDSKSKKLGGCRLQESDVLCVGSPKCKGWRQDVHVVEAFIFFRLFACRLISLAWHLLQGQVMMEKKFFPSLSDVFGRPSHQNEIKQVQQCKPLQDAATAVPLKRGGLGIKDLLSLFPLGLKKETVHHGIRDNYWP